MNKLLIASKSFFAVALMLLYATLVSAQSFKSEIEWEEYFNSKAETLDPMEGIWVINYTMKMYDRKNVYFGESNHPQFSKFAICKIGDNYKASELIRDPDNIYEQVNLSEIIFTKTASSGLLLMRKKYKYSFAEVRTTAFLRRNGLLELSYQTPEAQALYVEKMFNTPTPAGVKIMNEEEWIKISPKEITINKPKSGSGSGFMISSNGIIATNYHVVDAAKTIKVRGINSDFTKTYNAKVLVVDKNNDLALIQIDDNNFKNIGNIPFKIKKELSGVGENIWVLGYPLRASMGDEIKLTNGIISSKTGFQGDITTYQISAPVQPGNSGGPLFDKEGNIIGIISAKHGGAENVSYAVKASYLSSLIELIPNPPKLQEINTLSGKQLPIQVDIVKKLVLIIEVE